MIHAPVTEAYQFFCLLLSGGLTASVYVVLSFFRKNKGKIAVAFCDLAVVITAALTLFIALQIACGGKIRIFHIAGFIVGFLVFKDSLLTIAKYFIDLTKELLQKRRHED